MDHDEAESSDTVDPTQQDTMMKTFIETREFSEWVHEYLFDEHLSDLQRELLDDPDMGFFIPGGGGLRKVRGLDPRRGQGKREAVMVIYLHIAEVNQIHLIAIYAKVEHDYLSTEDKKSFRNLVQLLKDQATQPKGSEQV
jgi:hypothetical protein